MQSFRVNLSCGLGILALVLTFTLPAHAQEAYPTRPVEIIVPFAPGGLADATARAMAAVAEEYLGAPVVVVNQPGGGGAVGVQRVAGAEPDGYTLVWASPSALVAAQQQLEQISALDLRNELIPIVQMVEQDFVLVVPASSPYNTLDEFLAYARDHPGELTFAQTSISPSDPAAQLESMAAVELRRIPYGSSLIPPAVAGEHVDASHMYIHQAIPNIEEGSVRPLAVTGSTRNAEIPDIPTYEELGFHVFSDVKFGLIAPAGVSEEILNQLETLMHEVANDERFIEDIARIGAEQSFLAATEYQDSLARFIEGEAVAANGGVVREGGAFRSSRIFIGPHRFPPREFAAYGIVAFPVSPSAGRLRTRSLAICNAYWETLVPAGELFIPIGEQLVTVWPVTSDTLSEELNSEESSNVCDLAVDRYHVATAQQAIHDARQTVEEDFAPRILNGRGPFLLLWRPASMKGDADTLVLAIDFSSLRWEDQFMDAFRKWQLDVESSMELWPPLAETETKESYIDRARRWGDTWAPDMVDVISRLWRGAPR